MNFYGFAQRICIFFFSLYFNINVKGIENITSSEGKLMLISNHQSYLDPVMLGLYVKNRRLFFMAKQELFKVPILSCIIKRLGAFPVKRGSRDLGAIKMAKDLVNRGKIVAMFPEGTRSKSGKLLKPKVGAAKIALATGASIIPCSIFYCGKLPRSRVFVEYGRPISVLDVLQDSNLAESDLRSKSLKIVLEKVWTKVSEIHDMQRGMVE